MGIKYITKHILRNLIALVLLAALVAACAPATATPAGQAGQKATPTATKSAIEPTETPAPLSSEDIREPVVAGQFYPADPDTLETMVDEFLAQVDERAAGEPIGLIVPHAGYVYSGQVAAYAFKQIAGGQYDAVVVIGTNHHDPLFEGLSVWARGAFRTPLGLVPVDEELAQALLEADSRIVFNKEVHGQEHSIEVELPFLQRVLPDAKIVPVIVAAPTEENEKVLADALVKVLKGKKALLIASSDMSHYPAYDDAVRVDGETLKAIASMDPARVRAAIDEGMSAGVANLGTCLCGEGPVLAAMMAARGLGANRATVLKYANSGDVPFGGRDQVVGYGAVMFWRGEGAATSFVLPSAPTPPPPAPLTTEEKETLLTLARDTLNHFLRSNTTPPFSTTAPGLLQERGAFVTLKERGNLRGCRGAMTAEKPLYLTVELAAILSALDDPRFPPVAAEELSDIALEISVLGPLEPIDDVNEIEVGTHGLLIVKGENQGVFLPQVPIEQGWERDQYLEELCGKAGLPEGCWREDAQLYIFTAEVFDEES
jgi:AmmeMemoRadiSam system protein B/AmmeMemoRadiSam system protein A